MMRIKLVSRVLTVIACLFLVRTGMAAVQDQNWPREVTVAGNHVVVHQPQVDDWKDYAKIEARMVVEITPQGAKKPILGAVWVTADTATNLESRVVKLSNIKIAKVDFPALDEQASWKMTRLLQESIPTNLQEVSVDRILANLKRTREADRAFEGSREPPRIFVAEEPAILVQFDGDPVMYPIDGTDLKFAVNTNWAVFVDTKDKSYYLLHGKQWLTTKNLQKGPWTLVSKLPNDFSQIPADDNWSDVRKQVPPKMDEVAEVPAVYVSTRPAELVYIDGKPQLAKIEGTDLSEVTNASNPLFFYSNDKNYYFLVSGRWFKTSNLHGAWSAVGKDLPKEFSRIPNDGSREDVLASVPGTAQAQEALIQASIPQKAVVKRKEAKLDLKYNGEPKFEPIKGTSLKYAVNTPIDVIQVGSKYYACESGVWFVADSPEGPWLVADSIPDEIYRIPPSSPVYRTSYVYVYDSDEDEVEFGYTSGYLGAYEEYGTVVYGTGFYYPPYLWPGLRPIFWPRPYSYGCAAYYNPFTGNFVRAGAFYGPYRGIGRGAVYNPWTGTYARGTVVWGPRGAAWAGIAYTPATGWIAGGGSTFGHFRGAAPVNPYARWGTTATALGATGALGALASRDRMRTLREPGRIPAAGDKMRGMAGKPRDDLYVGKDGNIYRRSGKDKWERYTKARNWQPVTPGRDRPTAANLREGARPLMDQRGRDRRDDLRRVRDDRLKQGQAQEMRLRQQRADQRRLQEQRQLRFERERINRQRERAGIFEQRSYRSHRQIVSDLNRDFAARSRGQQRVIRGESFRQFSSPRSFGGGGFGMRGGGFRGGGRRR